MDLPDDAHCDTEQQDIDDFKTCYYCGKKMRADAPRCEVCGNDRSFTWTNKVDWRKVHGAAEKNRSPIR